MMTLNEARSKVTELNVRLLNSGLALSVNSPVAFKVGDRTRISWPQARIAGGTFAAEPYASLSEYRAFLSGNHFTCLLNEGSLVQISFDYRNDQMVAHRYCYYPCPLVVERNRYVQDVDVWTDMLEAELFAQIEALRPIADVGEDLGGGTGGILRLRSPIRFDYEPERQTDIEPASHVHIASADSRIPVYAALSLGQFLHFVLSQFHPGYLEALDGFGTDHHNRCISVEHEGHIHIDCRHFL